MMIATVGLPLVSRRSLQRGDRSRPLHIVTLLLKPQVSVTMTQGELVVGVDGWPVILTGWPDGGRGQQQVRVFTLHTGAGWAW